MAFTDDVVLAARGDGTYTGTPDPSYRNLIGPFGGWIAGVLLAPILAEPRLDGDPISSSTTFESAILDGPFTVRPRRLRTNRSTEFWFSELEQEQAGTSVHCASAAVALAKRRVTHSFDVAVPPKAPAPESIERVDPSPLGSSWLQKFDIRPVRGNPFVNVRGDDASDGDPDVTVGWVREVEGKVLDFATLTGLCDTTFPQIFGKVRARIPISTIVMNVFFHATSAELAAIGPDYLLMEARMHIAKAGYFDERTMLWSRDGRLLATTEQIVWYKTDPPA